MWPTRQLEWSLLSLGLQFSSFSTGEATSQIIQPPRLLEVHFKLFIRYLVFLLRCRLETRSWICSTQLSTLKITLPLSSTSLLLQTQALTFQCEQSQRPQTPATIPFRLLYRATSPKSLFMCRCLRRGEDTYTYLEVLLQPACSKEILNPCVKLTIYKSLASAKRPPATLLSNLPKLLPVKTSLWN